MKESKAERYQNRIESMLEPILEEKSLDLYDIDYVKEGDSNYLRVFIDKTGGVDINDCESVSKALEALLDEDDFIDEAYILEVSSPGLTRTLKKEKEFFLNKGKAVEIKLFKPVDEQKEMLGILKDYDKENKILTVVNDFGEHFINRKDISLIKLSMDYEREN